MRRSEVEGMVCHAVQQQYLSFRRERLSSVRNAAVKSFARTHFLLLYIMLDCVRHDSLKYVSFITISTALAHCQIAHFST
jgi:hypothetical protein